MSDEAAIVLLFSPMVVLTLWAEGIYRRAVGKWPWRPFRPQEAQEDAGDSQGSLVSHRQTTDTGRTFLLTRDRVVDLREMHEEAIRRTNAWEARATADALAARDRLDSYPTDNSPALGGQKETT